VPSDPRDPAAAPPAGGGQPPAARSVDLAPAEPVLAISLGAVAPAAPTAAPAAAAPVAPEPVPVPPVVDVTALDWDAVRRRVDPAAVRARLPETLARLEALLDRDGGPGFLFDADRAGADDRAIRVGDADAARPLWFVGDLHGDLLALEAALALVRQEAGAGPGDARDGSPGTAPDGAGAASPRLVFLGDLFDDGGYGLEVLARVFELLADDPGAVCVLAGNHDEALAWTGERFAVARVAVRLRRLPQRALGDEAGARAAGLAVRPVRARAARPLLPDGLLAAHAGFPLVDLHAELAARATSTTRARSPTSRGCACTRRRAQAPQPRVARQPVRPRGLRRLLRPRRPPRAARSPT
jgi:hypothetical protein